jgi:hypothetical protein
MRYGFLPVVVCLSISTTAAASGPSVDVAARAKGAAKVVIGTIASVEPGRYDTNEYGDRLIFTRAWMQVDETLKGSPQSLVAVDLEGGTVGDLTLRVSDIQLLRQGERAVLFLNAERNGAHTPNGRGTGVLRLDAAGHLQNTTITLTDLKRMVQSAAK